MVTLAALVSSLNLFAYCYFGKMATEHFLSYADHLFESKWYQLPNKLQRFLIPMIIDAQQPLHYHGSFIANLNLETFAKVRKYPFSILEYSTKNWKRFSVAENRGALVFDVQNNNNHVSRKFHQHAPSKSRQKPNANVSRF